MIKLIILIIFGILGKQKKNFLNSEKNDQIDYFDNSCLFKKSKKFSKFNFNFFENRQIKKKIFN